MSQGQKVDRFTTQLYNGPGPTPENEPMYFHDLGRWVRFSDYESIALRERLLREALQKYGQHDDTCQAHPDMLIHKECTCGYSAALAQETQEGSK